MKTKSKKKNKKAKQLKKKKSLKKIVRRRKYPRKKITKRKKIIRKRKIKKEEIVGKKDLVTDLINRGKQRGFVTEDEILHVIPNAEQNIADLESLYEKMEELGVRVISSDEMIKMETDKISEELEDEKEGKVVAKKDGILGSLGEDSETSSDLVQMRFDVGATAGTVVSNNVNAIGVKTISPLSILRQFKERQIDVFKIDIEGAEIALFNNNNCLEWIRATRYFAIEIHSAEGRKVVEAIMAQNGFNHHRYKDLDIFCRKS